jgi:hypothetical protein
LFRLRLRINIKRKDNTNVLDTDWKKISPVNYLLHSIFNYVHLEINNTPITMAPHTYSYKAYFDAILGFTKDARNSWMRTAGFFDVTDQSTYSEEQSKLIRPKTTSVNGDGKTFELIGKLHEPMVEQGKALPGGVTLKLTIVPNDYKFYLFTNDDTITPSVEFLDASLLIHKSKINYPVASAIESALEKGTAKYPICRGIVKTFNISPGTTDTTIDNAVNGVLPRRIFVSLVPNDAYSGNILKNPYNFKHYDLNFIAAYIDGQQYPAKAYTPDFANKNYYREYLGLFESLNQLTTDTTISLLPEQWENGNTIFGFNFAPDLSDDCSKMGFTSPKKSGALKLELKFAKALSETISVLVYCEYDSIIEIDKNREASTDYM